MYKYISFTDDFYHTTRLIWANIVFYVACFTKGVTRLSLLDRSLIAITEGIKDVLVGIFHGDGHIVTRSSTNNPRLVYAQTSVAHKKYFDIVYGLYMPFCGKD